VSRPKPGNHGKATEYFYPLRAGYSDCSNSKFIDIFLRKEEISAKISAMRNSIAESCPTAPTNIVTGRDARVLQLERVPAGGRKIFV
jgi:hypothetical protein